MTALRALEALLFAALAVATVYGIWLLYDFVEVDRWTLTDPLLPWYTPDLALWAFAGTLAAAFATASLVRLAEPLGAWWGGMAPGDDRVRVGAWSLVAFVVGMAAHVGLSASPGLDGVGSAALAGGTVPAVAWIGARWVGDRAGVLAAVLFATAPMVLLGHHSLTSATIATFVTAWAVVAVERARDADAPRGVDVALGGLVAVGIAVDPPVGAGVAVALAAVWAWDRRGAPDALARAALTGGAAAVALAVLVVASATPPSAGAGRTFDFAAWRVVVTPLVVVARLAIEALGWPLALAPLWFVGSGRGRAVSGALAVGVIGAQVFVTDFDPGVFGPERLQVLVLPVVWLTVGGIDAVRRWSASAAWGRLVTATTAASIAVAVLGYAPLREAALEPPETRFWRWMIEEEVIDEVDPGDLPDDPSAPDDVPGDEAPIDEAPPPEPAP